MTEEQNTGGDDETTELLTTTEKKLVISGKEAPEAAPESESDIVLWLVLSWQYLYIYAV